MRTLGIVTIGQTPRPDLVPHLRAVLPACRIVESGALDGLSDERVASLAPVSDDEESLTTRLGNGAPVVYAHRHATDLLNAAVRRNEQDGADVSLLACGSTFEGVRGRNLLRTQALVRSGVAALAGTGRVGIVRPLAGQVPAARAEWQRVLGRETPAQVADPFADGDDGIEAAARRLRNTCELVVLDCFGFTERHRAIAVRAAGVPVVLINTLAARLVAEVVAA